MAQAKGEALDVGARVFQGAEDGPRAERERATGHDDAGLAMGALLPLTLTLTQCGWRHAEVEAPGCGVFAIEDRGGFPRAGRTGAGWRWRWRWRRQAGGDGAGFKEEDAAEHLLDDAKPTQEVVASLATDDDFEGDGFGRE